MGARRARGGWWGIGLGLAASLASPSAGAQSADDSGTAASAPARQPAPPASSAQDPPSSHSADDARRTTGPDTARTIGWVLGAVGGAALGVGVGFGLRAISLKSEADTWCTDHLCTPRGLSIIDDAKIAAAIATVGVIAGIAGVGAGAWWVFRSTPGSGHAHLAAWLAPDRAGLVLRGGW